MKKKRERIFNQRQLLLICNNLFKLVFFLSFQHTDAHKTVNSRYKAIRFIVVWGFYEKHIICQIIATNFFTTAINE